MTLLKLIYKNLVDFVKNKTFIFVCIIIGVMVSSFCLNYYSSTLKKEILEYKKYNTDDRRINVVFSNSIEGEEIYKIIKDIRSKYKIEQIKLFDDNAYYFSSRFIDDTKQASSANSYGVMGIDIPDDFYDIDSGRKLNKNDKDKPNAIMPFAAETISNKDGKQVLVIDNKEYFGIGKHRNYYYENNIYVTYDFFIKNNLARAINIVFDKTPTVTEINQIRNIFNKIDSGVKIISPIQSDEYLTTALVSMIFPIIILMFCLISIVALIKYMHKSNNYRYAIYKICGIRKSQLFALLTFDIAIITIIGYILGSGFYFVMNTFLDLGVNNLSFLERILICVVLFILTMFASMPVIISTVKKFNSIK